MKNKYNKNCYSFPLLIASLLLMSSCNSQVKPLAEATLALENFDFNTNVSSLLREKDKSKEYENFWNVKSMVIGIDTVFTDEFDDENRKPIRLDYRPSVYSARDKIATFGDMNFYAINMVTTLDNKIMVMSGSVPEVSEQEVKTFVSGMNKKHGDAVKTTDDFFGPYDIYTWKLADRIIKYCVIYDDESNVLKIEVDKEKKSLKGVEKTPHYKAYLFTINNKYADQVIGKMNTGDLLYCK
ncbi:MAG: hypothetical protein ABI266_02220 [Ginsengibacter sp.]